MLDFNSEVPIYMQLAQGIKDGIISGVFNEQIPSTTEVSVMYKINPATVGKGYNLLVEQGIIYKKRGVGMFVSEGAKDILIKERREDFYERYIDNMIKEAEKINISENEIIDMIKERVK